MADYNKPADLTNLDKLKAYQEGFNYLVNFLETLNNQVDGHTDNEEIHVNQADKDIWNAKVSDERLIEVTAETLVLMSNHLLNTIHKYGLGTTEILDPPDSNLDTITESGTYYWGGDYVGAPLTDQGGHVEHTNKGNYAIQRAFPDSNTNMLIRVKRNGVWLPWDTVTTTRNSRETPWIDASLRNGWVRYSSNLTPKYRKTPDNRVEILGTVKDGAENSVVYVLPEGYRPRQQILFLAPSFGITDFQCRCSIETNGEVRINYFGRPDSNNAVNLSFTFSAKD